MSSSKPEWLRVQAPSGERYAKVKSLLRGLQLHTVCEEAQCPNAAVCWGAGTATVMILGDVCTRSCRFCAVESGDPHGKIDHDEPNRVARAVSELGLAYVVVTSVDRDDLADGGSMHYSRTISAIKETSLNVTIEALIPDFRGDEKALSRIVEAGPEVIGHNIETVERLTPRVRDRRTSYSQSIEILRAAKRMNPNIHTKSSIMLGLGEKEDEVVQAFRDLRGVGVDILTIGQYLRPSEWHIPVEQYVTPELFKKYHQLAEECGFLHTASGPLVRSSYRASELFLGALARREKAVTNGR